MKPCILLVEDDPAARFGFVKYLGKSGFDFSEAENLSQAEELFSARQFDAIILDIHLPDGSGIDFIDRVREISADIPLIVITGAGEIPLAVDAMRRGADNFLIKPVDMAGLELFLQKCLEVGTLRKQRSSRLRLEKKEDALFGNSPLMQEVVALARMAAENDCPVLITGETGTGKGILANWIHRHSDRSSFAFVELNCSGLKGDLLARELFGNVRGAFTSADRDREGLLSSADGGTLFLDEIGEMDPAVQAQFLKVIEEKTYRRLGDTRQQRSDFRLVCATNKQIEESLQKGEFRRDLYFRINLLTIHIPPLRERIEDLPELTHHLLKTGRTRHPGITEEALRILQAYSWPGNVRELKNVLERAVILSRANCLTAEHFSWLQTAALSQGLAPASTLGEMEQNHILAALERSGGDVAKAARSLGISRATVYRRLKQLHKKS
jgi:DNA-binding NtrC family response regulator